MLVSQTNKSKLSDKSYNNLNYIVQEEQKHTFLHLLHTELSASSKALFLHLAFSRLQLLGYHLPLLPQTGNSILLLQFTLHGFLSTATVGGSESEDVGTASGGVGEEDGQRSSESSVFMEEELNTEVCNYCTICTGNVRRAESLHIDFWKSKKSRCRS